jgi:hypothetical protein
MNTNFNIGIYGLADRRPAEVSGISGHIGRYYALSHALVGK